MLLFYVKWLIAVWIFSLDRCPSSGQSIATNPELIRLKCEELNSNDLNEELLDFLQRVEDNYSTLSVDQLLPSLYTYKGVALYNLNRYEEAGDSFNAAVELNPRDLRAWINLAQIREIYPSSGNFVEAMRKVELLVNLPEDVSGNITESHVPFRHHTVGSMLRNAYWKDLEQQQVAEIQCIAEYMNEQKTSSSVRRGSGMYEMDLQSVLFCPKRNGTIDSKAISQAIMHADINGTVKAQVFQSLLTSSDSVVERDALEPSPSLLPTSGGRDGFSGVSPRQEQQRQKHAYFSPVLHLGFILADLNDRPIYHLAENLFPYLNRQVLRVRTYAFFLCKRPLNNTLKFWQMRLMESFDNITFLAGVSHRVSANRISSLNIDVLVDLNGLSIMSGLPIMRYRAAPVQVSFLGDPITTGTKDYIDYFLGDPVASPPDITASHFVESVALLKMGVSYLVNSHGRSHRHVPLLEAMTKPVLMQKTSQYSCLELHEKENQYAPPYPPYKNDFFLFGAVHNIMKIEPIIFQVWMNVLRRTGGSDGQTLSKLLLSANSHNCQVDETLIQHARMFGVIDSRVLFLKSLTRSQHVHYKTAVDLFLDTSLSKSGHVTSVDAAWAGSPIIGLMGQSTMPLRAAESIATALGANEGMVYSLKEYEDMAVQLATSTTNTARCRHSTKQNDDDNNIDININDSSSQEDMTDRKEKKSRCQKIQNNHGITITGFYKSFRKHAEKMRTIMSVLLHDLSIDSNKEEERVRRGRRVTSAESSGYFDTSAFAAEFTKLLQAMYECRQLSNMIYPSGSSSSSSNSNNSSRKNIRGEMRRARGKRPMQIFMAQTRIAVSVS